VNHPNIVHAYDAGPIGGQHMIVMEYVEGIDLARRVAKSGPLPVGEACEDIRQGAVGLQHAHERGLVHRDIQPANLLLTAPLRSGVPGSGSAVVKILDLGLGRLLKKQEDDSGKSQITMQGSNDIAFSDYTAPEQALDFHAADIRADIYALGASLFFLLTGRSPLPTGSPGERLLHLQQAGPPALEQFRKDLPPGLVPIFRRMMAWRAEDRYQMPAEVAQALAPFSSAQPWPPLAIPVASVTPAPASAPALGKRGFIALGAVALGLLFIWMGLALLLGGRSNDPATSKSVALRPDTKASTVATLPRGPVATTAREPLVPPQNKADPTGTWRWVNQLGDRRLKLKLDGDKLSGSYIRDGRETPIEDAWIKDGEFGFTATYQRNNGQKLIAKYFGKLSGDEIKGKSEFTFGGQSRSRDWEAKRIKE
jgi:serine/threonine protein kinase